MSPPSKLQPGNGPEPPAEDLPEINSVVPASAPPGAEITLSGANFGRRGSASQVTVRPNAPDLSPVAAAIVSWTDTEVRARVPALDSLGAPGRATLTLRTSVGVGSTHIVVLGTRQPVIQALSPASALPGAELRITGDSFGTTATPGQGISFSGVPVPFTNWSRREIRLPVPTTAAPGTGQVRVHTPWGVSEPATFTILELPSVASVSPGEAAPDQMVTVTGRGFGTYRPGASTVQLSFREADTGRLVTTPMEVDPAAWTATSIRVVTPGLAALKESGDKELTVHTATGVSPAHPFGVKDVASITTWTRIEPRARTDDLDLGLRVGLRAELADPMWLLGRQWVLGELNGEDAGSPVAARVEGETVPLRRWRPGSGGPPADLPAGAPLEAVVERERVLPSSGSGAPLADLRLAAEAGLRFLRLLDSHLAPQRAGRYRSQYLQAYPLDVAPPATDPDSRRVLAVLAGRAPDGGRLYAELLQALPPERGGAGRLPPAPRIDLVDQPAVLAAVADWYAWWTSLVDEPADGAWAWQPERLEYTFAVAAHTSTGEVVLEAPEHADGQLHWYALRRGTGSLGQPDGGPGPTPIAMTVVPAPVSYPGMPAARWWEIEDAAVNLGAVEAGPLDLAHLLLVEFATVFGNDWYAIPLGGQPLGSLIRLREIRVTDTFGEPTTAVPFQPTGPGGTFRLFQPSDSVQPTGAGGDSLLVLPATVLGGIESAPVEEVVFIRDELANLAWAVERTVTSRTGRPLARPETRSAASAPPGPAPSYELMTPVPEPWIPLVPAVDGTSRRLARAALRRTLPDGSTEPVLPLGRILQPDEPALHLYDAEIPPEGVRVTRVWRLARDAHGYTHLWLARQKQTVIRQPSPGLRFDTVREPDHRTGSDSGRPGA